MGGLRQARARRREGAVRRRSRGCCTASGSGAEAESKRTQGDAGLEAAPSCGVILEVDSCLFDLHRDGHRPAFAKALERLKLPAGSFDNGLCVLTSSCRVDVLAWKCRGER